MREVAWDTSVSDAATMAKATSVQPSSGLRSFQESQRMLRHDLPSAVNGVLSEFRAFVGHIDRWARDALGENERAAVAAQARKEYDRSFHYRLACNLRNTAQHRTSVVAVSMSSTEIAPGIVADSLRVTVAPDAVDSRWQPRVRREFEALSDPVDLVDLLKGLMRSCERIVARLLLVAEHQTGPAIHLVVDAGDEVREVTGDPAAAVSIMDDELAQRPDGTVHGQLHLAALRRDRAVNLADMTQAASALLG